MASTILSPLLNSLWKYCCIVLLAFPGACGHDRSKPARSICSDKADVTDNAQLWADSIYNAMSIEERLAQMLMPAVYARTDVPSMHDIRRYALEMKVGGILLLKGDAVAAAEIADTLESIRNSLPHSPGLFLSMDAETGLGMRFSDAPLFPWNRDIDSSADDQDFYDYGREVGREARIAGINMILGPVMDINRTGLNKSGIMEKRSLGSDPQRVARLSSAYIMGLESQGVAAIPKHFPGHGPTDADSHDRLPVIHLSLEELQNMDLIPFQVAIGHGTSGIMVGHLWVPAIDSIRRPASFSEVVIDGLLRMVMGYRGLILIDAVNMGAAKGYTGADAIIAGADIIIAPADTRKELQNLKDALNEGRLTEKQVEKSCKRILLQKYIQNVHKSCRSKDYPADTKIQERLRREAPDIIYRLKGISR